MSKTKAELETEEKGQPCPVCNQKLVLRYDEREPNIRQDPVSGRYRVPMRCCRCNINLEVALNPDALLPETEE